MSRCKSCLSLFTLLLALTAYRSAFAGPIVTVGAVVPPAAQVPVDSIDHSAWNRLLQTYVDSEGRVDYRGWKASAADVKQLDAYLVLLSSAKVHGDSGREARLAFWINAYNAVTIKGILREYPTTSIRNHTAKLIGYNIWKDLRIPVDGRHYSLEAIEHEVLRKMGEPRIHFAIVCASKGCPRLLSEAYAADKLDRQLTLNARQFFSDRGKLTYEASSATLHVSPILSWFADDFGTDSAAQIRTVSPYLPDSVRKAVAAGGTRVKYLDYDWSLNDAAVRSASRR